MILFLDFDGVMHPVNQVALFCREEHLARVLRGFPDVELVISSAWRQTHTLKLMQTFFLTELRSRVVGVTPVLQVGDADTSAAPGMRYQEIKKYLADTDNHSRRWIALDDDAQLFPPRCAELLLCDAKFGFGEVEERALRAMLQSTAAKEARRNRQP